MPNIVRYSAKEAAPLYVATAQMMGADLAYIGTRFIATKEAMAQSDYKDMIVKSRAQDIVYTPKISGVYANFLRPSLDRAGIDLATTPYKTEIDFGSELTMDEKEQGAWKDIWSAGQGVGSIDDVPHVKDLIHNMKKEYVQAVTQQADQSKKFMEEEK